MKPLPTPRVVGGRRRRNMSENGLPEGGAFCSPSSSSVSRMAMSSAETVSMLTTAGSTRRAISANEADKASGAHATCASFCAMAGWPASKAPMNMPLPTQTTASAMIQTRMRLRSCCSISRGPLG